MLVWMSRGWTPARASAARTRSIRAAFWRIASTAVGAWVTTPALIRTMSGTRVTSPVATMSSRVPPIVAAGWLCASAALAGIVAANRASVLSSFISMPPRLGHPCACPALHAR